MGHRPFGDCECNGTHACHRTISIRNYHVHTCKCYSAHRHRVCLLRRLSMLYLSNHSGFALFGSEDKTQNGENVIFWQLIMSIIICIILICIILHDP